MDDDLELEKEEEETTDQGHGEIDAKSFFTNVVGLAPPEDLVIQLHRVQPALDTERAKQILQAGSGRSFSKALVPYTVECIKRYTPPGDLSLVLARAIKEDSSTSLSEPMKNLLTYRLKDRESLMMALEVCPPSVHRPLLQMWQRMGKPMPFLVPSPEPPLLLGASEIKPTFIVSGLPLLPLRPLLVNVGTPDALGKSTFLKHLFHSTVTTRCTEPHLIPPLHHGSIDLLLADGFDDAGCPFTIADVAAPAFLPAVRALLRQASVVCLHVKHEDFDKEARPLPGAPQEIVSLLADAMNPQTKVIVIFRDFKSQKAELTRSNNVGKRLERILNRKLTAVPIFSLVGQDEINIANQLLSLSPPLKEALSTSKKGLNCLQLWEDANATCGGGQSESSEVYWLGPGLGGMGTEIKEVQKLISPMVPLEVNEWMQQFFPFSFSKQKLRSLMAKRERVYERTMDKSKAIDVTQQISRIQGKIAALKRSLPALKSTELTKYFACLVRKGRFEEFEPLFLLLDELLAVRQISRTECRKKYLVTKGEVEELTEATKKVEMELEESDKKPALLEKLNKQLCDLKEQLKQKSKALEKAGSDLRKESKVFEHVDLSVDQFWRELELITSHSSNPDAQMGITVQEFSKAYSAWILSGAPMQILSGSPLHMDFKFLQWVLEDTNLLSGDQRPYILSIIGAQSSAKSTLLNMLFGTGFRTSAGRCTRGLYVSHLEVEIAPGKWQSILVLDSEGLLSVEARDMTFDRQMTLLLLALSHQVIINVKGELTSSLQDILKICLYSSKELLKLKHQPQLRVVLRDMSNTNPKNQQEQMRSLVNSLEEAAKAASLGSLKQAVVFDQMKDMHLFPPALAKKPGWNPEEGGNGYDVVEWQSTFTEECLKLRNVILSDIREFVAPCKERPTTAVSWTFSEWMSHVKATWKCISHFGNSLLHYGTLVDIKNDKLLRKRVKEFKEQHLFNPTNGSDATTLWGQLAAKQRDLLTQVKERKKLVAQVVTEFSKHQKDIGERFRNDMEHGFRDKYSGQFSMGMVDKGINLLLAYVDQYTKDVETLWQPELSVLSQDELRYRARKEFLVEIEKLADGRCVKEEKEMNELFEKTWNEVLAKENRKIEGQKRSNTDIDAQICRAFNAARAILMGEEKEESETEQEQEKEKEKEKEADRKKTDRKKIQIGSRKTLKGEYQHTSIFIFMKPLQESAIEDASFLPFKVTVTEEVLKPYYTKWKKLYTMIISNKNGLDLISEKLRRFFDEVGRLMRNGDRYLSDMTAQSILHQIDALVESLHSQDLIVGPFINDLLRGVVRELRKVLVTNEDRFIQGQLKTIQGRTFKEDLRALFQMLLASHDDDQQFVSYLASELKANMKKRFAERLNSKFYTKVAERFGIPDPVTIIEQVYVRSFKAKEWEEVLKYVDNMPAYLEEIYRKEIETNVDNLFRRKSEKLQRWGEDVWKTIVEEIIKWGTPFFEVEDDQLLEEKQAQFRMAKQKMILHFVRIFEEPRNVSELKKLESDFQKVGLCTCTDYPTGLSFLLPDKEIRQHFEGREIMMPQSFCKSLLERLTEPNWEKMVKAHKKMTIREMNIKFLAKASGCHATCPWCSNKCKFENGHKGHHECSFHLLAVFGGTSMYPTKHPAREWCSDPSFCTGNVRHKDQSIPFQKYMEDYHRSWLIGEKTWPSLSCSVDKQDEIRAAWIGCRAVLLRRYNMVDDTPAEWVKAYSGPNFPPPLK